MKRNDVEKRRGALLRVIALLLTVGAAVSLSGCFGSSQNLYQSIGDVFPATENNREYPAGQITDYDPWNEPGYTYEPYVPSLDEYEYEPPIPGKLDFEIKEEDAPLEVEYYYESLDGGVYVYDTDYLYMIFGDSKVVTKNDLLDALNGNPNINDKYKALIREYIDLLYARYPNNNYRVFYENLKTMIVHECVDKFEMFEHALSMDAYACYVPKENTIYTSDTYDYKKGTWDYQTIMHELSHAMRIHRDESGKVNAEFPDLVSGNIILDEAMNSIFAVSLFDYDEPDIAYQLQSNIILAIVSSMDNYDLNDYVNHSSSYFTKKLDEFTGHTNYAQVMLKVMYAQYRDYHDKFNDVEESEFYPFYRFICDIYFKNRLKAGMSDHEKESVVRELVDRITFDVPAEYHIDTDYFYGYYNEYLASHGLS